MTWDLWHIDDNFDNIEQLFLLERELSTFNRKLSWNIIFFNLRNILENLRSKPTTLIFYKQQFSAIEQQFW